MYQKDIYHYDMERRQYKKRINQSLFAILGLLSLGAMTGYELRKVSNQSIQHFWREGFGQIYPSLRKLEEAGLVSRKLEKSVVGGRPPRQLYEITGSGRAALREWVASPSRPEVPRNELLLKIFLGARVPAHTNLRQIAESRQAFAEKLAGYVIVEKQIQEAYKGHPDLPYWLLTLDYGKRCTQAELSWCEEATAAISKLDNEARGGNGDA